jgi:hypothetical protein
MKNFKTTIIFLFAFVLAINFCAGQKTNPAQKDSIVGVWKGTSICQVKNSPCHDEIAVYHISKTEKQNVYRCIGNKIVNGQEVEMGEMEFLFDPTKRNLTSVYKETSTWTFAVSGDNMHGTLISNNVLFRIVDLKRLK